VSLVPRVWLAIAIGLIVAGVVLLAAEANVAALAVGGLGGVLLVSAVFYAVGRSEDLERERRAGSGAGRGQPRSGRSG
jgi:membrane-bound ClpP family serine protease